MNDKYNPKDFEEKLYKSFIIYISNNVNAVLRIYLLFIQYINSKATFSLSFYKKFTAYDFFSLL